MPSVMSGKGLKFPGADSSAGMTGRGGRLRQAGRDGGRPGKTPPCDPNSGFRLGSQSS